MAQRKYYCSDRMCGALDCATCYGPGDDGEGCEHCGADYVDDCECPYLCGDCGDTLEGEPERDEYGRPEYGQCEHCRVAEEAYEAGTLYDHPLHRPKKTDPFYSDDLPF